MDKLILSAVICTYNRDRILSRVLNSILDQKTTSAFFEILVVDNNSTDNTKAVIEGYFQAIPNLKYIFEPRQGLSQARNRGWQEAQGEYVGYLDDDAKAPPHWLETVLKIIEEHQPDVFGGPYFAYYDTEPPAWWKDSYRSFVPFEKSRDLERGEYLSGGNFFVKRELLEDLQGFDAALGIQGKQILLGEETDLQQRIRENFPSAIIFYEPDLYIHHLVPAQNMSLTWKIKRRWGEGRSSYYLSFDDSTKNNQILLKIPLYCVRIIVRIFYGLIFRDKRLYPYYMNYLFEVVLNDLTLLGRGYEVIKNI